MIHLGPGFVLQNLRPVDQRNAWLRGHAQRPRSNIPFAALGAMSFPVRGDVPGGGKMCALESDDNGEEMAHL